MRLPKIVRKLSPCLAALGAGLLLTSHVVAQDLAPSVRFNVDSGNWGQAGNWADRVTAANRLPGEDDIAAILNGGTVNLGSDVGTVKTLSIRDGLLALNAGGALTVSDQTIIGEGASLAAHGGRLTTGSLAMFGRVDVPSDADLSIGNSWPVATAGTVVGAPSVITVGGSVPDLDRGLRLQFVANDTGAAVTIGNEPILVVDRADGSARIQNFSGAPLDLKGYSIESESALLNMVRRPRWESLKDQDVPGWDEANPTRDTRLSEYNLTSFLTIGAGASQGIGTPFGAGVGLPPREEDLTFEYIRADGRVFDGQVFYEGPPNDLVLTIDPETGSASISNDSSLVQFDVAGYSILSESGSLLPDNFTGIGGDWLNANPQTTALADLNLEGSMMFGQNTSVDIGNIFDPNGRQDLKFRFSTAANTLREGTIIYGKPTPVVEFHPADFDMNGTVDFPDFLFLSNLFGQSVDPPGTPPDIDGSGTVDFADFLTLSSAFGQSTNALAAVPEPSTGILALLGFLGMLRFRKRSPHLAVVLAATCLCGTAAQPSMAEDFDVRFIRLHPDGPNNQINNTLEAVGIVKGSVLDAVINEDIEAQVPILDFAGGDGSFAPLGEPYPNGVADTSMDDFLVYTSGVLEIPAGEWTIGCGSDDGCWINMPGVSFQDTYGENGPTVDGDGQIIFNAPRGHAWTLGTFTAPAGGLTTGFEAIFFERGGGDSFEVAILDLFPDPSDPFADFVPGAGGFPLALELEDGSMDWDLTGAPFMGGSPGDFNGDGVVNDADAEAIQENFGEAGTLANGDITGDGFVDFHDLSQFFPIYLAAQPGGAQSVPEPASFATMVLGLLALFGLRRKTRC